MALPRQFFRKIAAATAVVCEELHGPVGRLDLMKILYASDRETLRTQGRTITGDTYFSLKKGPILSATLNLANDDHGGPFQKEWNEAFEKTESHVVLRTGVTVDKDCLSDDEENLIRQKARELSQEKEAFMTTWGSNLGAYHWTEHLHRKWREWCNPGTSRLPLPITDILEKGLQLSPEQKQQVLDSEHFSRSVAERNALSENPIIAARG